MFKLIGKLIKYTIYGSISVVVLLLGIGMMLPEDYKSTSTNIPTKEVVEVVEEEKVIEVVETVEDKEAEKAKKAEEKAIAKAKREEEKRIAEQKKIEEELAKETLLAEKKAEEVRKGFHCLSAWNGSHRGIVKATKTVLKDPRSFEHIQTRVTPVQNFKHTLYMDYRAKNGFGGMTVGTVVATYSNASCDIFTIVSID